MDMKEEIEEIASSLNSEDVNERIVAINKLGQIRSENSLNILLDAAKHETDVNARIALIKLIGNQVKIVERVEETLFWYSRDTNSQVRRSSIEALNKLNSELLTSVLLERIADFDKEIRFFSMDLAGSKKIKECSGKLISILNEADDTATIIRVSKALGKIQSPEAAEILFHKFKTGPNEARSELSNILTSFGESPKNDFLRILSDSEDPQLLQLSIGALQTIGGEDVIESISKFLHNPNPIVQNAAGNAMINLDGTIKYIIKEFLEEPGNQKIHEILSNKGSKAVKNLLSLKNHDEQSVTNNVDIILTGLMNRSETLLSSGSTQQKIDATEAYLKLLDENHTILNRNEVKQHIETNTSSEELKLQKISLKALRKIGDPSSIIHVESLLRESNDAEVIIEALITLGEFKHVNTIEAIRNKVKSEKVEIRREAVVALGRIWREHPSSDATPLMKLLFDPDSMIQSEAILIAQKLKKSYSISPLKELVEHGKNKPIRERASSVLDEFQSHFIEILSSSSSEGELLTAIGSLINIDRSNDRLIDVLFERANTSAFEEVRQSAVRAFGNLGNEEILERLNEIDVANPRVREARNWAIKLLSQVDTDSEEKTETVQISEDTIALTREGIFFQGQTYDAFRSIRNILRNAEENITIIDGYVDDSILDFLTDKKKKVEVKILIRPQSATDLLKSAANRFNEQYENLSIRTSDAFHDRFIIIDQSDYYHIGASIAHLGQRTFMFSKIEEPSVITELTANFITVWNGAEIII